MTKVFPPPWLNTEFLQHALSENSNCESRNDIISFQITPGSLEGDNFTSAMYKTSVCYRRKENQEVEKKYFIIKDILEDGQFQEILKEGKLIEKEMRIYNEVFPLVERLIGDIEIIPKHFPSNRKNTLVLEDLCKEGYVMCDKFNQFDFEHSAIVMKSLAKYHAMSVALNIQNPELIASVGEVHVFKPTSTNMHRFVLEKLKTFEETVQKWEGFERFGEMIRRIRETYFDRVVNLFTKRRLNVLNHGDFWNNNILFKRDENGRVVNVKFVDFQMAMYASVGIDINNVTWSSIQPSVRAHRLTELHSIYLETLNSSLEEFGCAKKMTCEEFEDEITFTLFYAFYAVFCNLAIMITTQNELDNKNKSNNKNYGYEKTPLSPYDKSFYKAHAQQILIYLENKGFFNYT